MATRPEDFTREELETARRLRTRSAKEIEAEYDKRPKTKGGDYRATQRGYAGGSIIDPPSLVPAGVVISDEWMEKVGKGDDTPVQRAVDDAQAQRKDDPALEELSKPALEALATKAGVTSVKGLSKEDLITAIRASDEQRRL